MCSAPPRSSSTRSGAGLVSALTAAWCLPSSLFMKVLLYPAMSPPFSQIDPQAVR
jgi:hypothetical protein